MDAVDAGWARRALPGFFSPLEVVASVPTTMARAAELAAAGEPEGATVVAEEQTEGRGRLGRARGGPPGAPPLGSGGGGRPAGPLVVVVGGAPPAAGSGGCLAERGRGRGRPGRGGRRGRPHR